MANLIILARTKRFERYVYFLIGCGPIFVLLANTLTGGVTTSSGALVWAFLTPAYALLALGPRRATPFFLIFLATIVVAVVIDPFVRDRFAGPPYVVQLVFLVQNVGVPLTITFLLLRYTDLRRRAAEARSDELLTNAIPASIAARLKHGESRIAEAYPATSVVFADIVGFTPWAQRTDPARVVTLLDDLFSRFDGDRRRARHREDQDRRRRLHGRRRRSPGARRPRVRRPRLRTGAPRRGRRAGAWRTTSTCRFASGSRAVRSWAGSSAGAGSCSTSGATPSTPRPGWSRRASPGRIHLAASTHALLDDSVAVEVRQVDIKGLGLMTTYLLAEPAG